MPHIFMVSLCLVVVVVVISIVVVVVVRIYDRVRKSKLHAFEIEKESEREKGRDKSGALKVVVVMFLDGWERVEPTSCLKQRRRGWRQIVLKTDPLPQAGVGQGRSKPKKKALAKP